MDTWSGPPKYTYLVEIVNLSPAALQDLLNQRGAQKWECFSIVVKSWQAAGNVCLVSYRKPG